MPTKQSEIQIIPMTLTHVPQVMEVERQSFSTPWSKDAYIFELLHNEVAHYLVSMVGDLVVGYAGVWTMVDEAHVTNIAVLPLWRRQKIGERLMLELISLAKEHGCSKMTLEVRKSNWGARDLYEKLGFIALGCRRNYYSDTKEDAIIMWKYNL